MAITAAHLQVLVEAKGAKDTSRELDDLSGKISGAASKFGVLAAAGAATGGLALAGGLGASIKVAADFEGALGAVSAATGATTQDMVLLRTEALAVGRDTSKSASEAVSAFGDLARAGVSVTDIVGGVGRTTVQLAEATGTSVGSMATLLSDSLNVFKLGASDATAVADTLVRAAGASSISVEDLAMSMSAGGLVAQSAGLDINEFATAIGIMGNQGLKSSDAGTSFKAMIAGLTPTSKEATATMRELGIQVFDAQGNFRSFPEILASLQQGFAGLTEEQRANAAETLFGSDGVRAFNALLSAQNTVTADGKNGWEQYTSAMEAVPDAAEQSSRRMDGLNGAMEQLKGSLETVAIGVGTVFLPVLADLVTGATDLLNAFGPDLIAGISGFSDALGTALASGDFQPFLDKIEEFGGTIMTKVEEWGAALVDWIEPRIGPMTEKAIAFLGAFTEWAVGTALPAIIETLATWEGALVDWILPQVPGLLENLRALQSEMLGYMLNTALPAITAQLAEWGVALIEWIEPRTPTIIAALNALMSSMGQWMLTEALPMIVAKLAEWGLAFVEWVGKEVVPKLPGALRGIQDSIERWLTGTAIPWAKTALVDLGRDLIQGFINGMSGKLGDVISKAGELAQAAVDKIKTFGRSPWPDTIASGKDYGTGFAAGIGSMSGAVNSAAGQLAGGAIGILNAGSGAVTGLSSAKPWTLARTETRKGPGDRDVKTVATTEYNTRGVTGLTRSMLQDDEHGQIGPFYGGPSWMMANMGANNRSPAQIGELFENLSKESLQSLNDTEQMIGTLTNQRSAVQARDVIARLDPDQADYLIRNIRSMDAANIHIANSGARADELLAILSDANRLDPGRRTTIATDSSLYGSTGFDKGLGRGPEQIAAGGAAIGVAATTLGGVAVQSNDTATVNALAATQLSNVAIQEGGAATVNSLAAAALENVAMQESGTAAANALAATALGSVAIQEGDTAMVNALAAAALGSVALQEGDAATVNALAAATLGSVAAQEGDTATVNSRAAAVLESVAVQEGEAATQQIAAGLIFDTAASDFAVQTAALDLATQDFGGSVGIFEEASAALANNAAAIAESAGQQTVASNTQETASQSQIEAARMQVEAAGANADRGPNEGDPAYLERMRAVFRIQNRMDTDAPVPFARGGVTKGGLSLVGELGPEIVKLPRGTEVFSHALSAQWIKQLEGLTAYAGGTVSALDTVSTGKGAGTQAAASVGGQIRGAAAALDQLTNSAYDLRDSVGGLTSVQIGLANVTSVLDSSTAAANTALTQAEVNARALSTGSGQAAGALGSVAAAGLASVGDGGKAQQAKTAQRRERIEAYENSFRTKAQEREVAQYNYVADKAGELADLYLETNVAAAQTLAAQRAYDAAIQGGVLRNNAAGYVTGHSQFYDRSGNATSNQIQTRSGETIDAAEFSRRTDAVMDQFMVNYRELARVNGEAMKEAREQGQVMAELWRDALDQKQNNDRLQFVREEEQRRAEDDLREANRRREEDARRAAEDAEREAKQKAKDDETARNAKQRRLGLQTNGSSSAGLETDARVYAQPIILEIDKQKIGEVIIQFLDGKLQVMRGGGS